MTKIGRNAPCPCGSGKKYKHCCLGKKDSPNSIGKSIMAESKQQLQEELNRHEDFESLEEVQAVVDKFYETKNNASQPEFLGFSPSQMYRILHRPLEEISDIVHFDTEFDSDLLLSIPVVKNSFIFLQTMADMRRVKATSKGNLSLAFVKTVFNAIRFDSPMKRQLITSEESTEIFYLRHFLVLCGWVKKQKGYFSLTKKGEKIVDKGFNGDAYFHLFQRFTRKYNWGFADGYPEAWIIQGSYIFSLYLVHQLATDLTDSQELADKFVDAYPMALEDFVEKDSYGTPEDELSRCFSIRFLERFCLYFGLIEIKREKIDNSWREKLYIKKSNFYDKFVHWKEKDKIYPVTVLPGVLH